MPALRAWLRQGMNDPMPLERSVRELGLVMQPPADRNSTEGAEKAAPPTAQAPPPGAPPGSSKPQGKKPPQSRKAGGRKAPASRRLGGRRNAESRDERR